MKYRSDVSLLSFFHLSTKAQAVEIRSSTQLKPLAEYITTFPFMSHNAHTYTPLIRSYLPHAERLKSMHTFFYLYQYSLNSLNSITSTLHGIGRLTCCWLPVAAVLDAIRISVPVISVWAIS